MGNRKLSKRQAKRVQSIQDRQRQRAAQQNISQDLDEYTSLGSETTGIVISNYGTQVDIEGDHHKGLYIVRFSCG